MGWGYWILEVVKHDDDRIDFWEADACPDCVEEVDASRLDQARTCAGAASVSLMRNGGAAPTNRTDVLYTRAAGAEP